MKYFLFTILLIPSFLLSQSAIDRIEPPNWWIGMQWQELQIMVYGEHIANLKPEIDYEGVSINRTISVENENYLFIYLDITETASPGKVSIQFKNGDNKVVETVAYPLESRVADAANRKGYDNSDVMYLITPDRFANGDPANDNVEGMPDKLNRSDKWGRHGGDIQGIIQHLDYLADIGFTAIWLNPILENNQPQASYHGYSTTDYYKIDPRFGSNEQYRELSAKASENGVKIIMDMIMNHCGSGHWWMTDLPSKNWVNNPDNFFRTNHRRTTLRDPYASDYDRDHFTDGWFVPTMPDMNQRNPLVSDYLIQNTIWWIEYIQLAGIRMDTYPYSDKGFMRDWTCAIMNEYPNFNICGEEWSLNPAVLAYWQAQKVNPDGYVSCLPGLLDFPLQNALKTALVEEENWNKGMINLYDMLSNDFLYADPFKHVIFPDNHDMSRIFTQLNEDIDLFKMTMIYFSTMRGTPQFYYGTEILMSNTGDDSHGNIRSDYPGGWEGDKVNAFTDKGLTDDQLEARQFVKDLLNWRKKAVATHSGKLMHFIPQNGVYTYFRLHDEQRLMVVMNKTEESQKVDLMPFAEVLPKGSKGTDVLSGKEVMLQDHMTIGPKQAQIIELK
ncbi:MAG: glycoside hydrolase family 13 protein [Bacteroidota bacterium]